MLHSLLRAEDHRSPMSALAREVSMTSGGFTKLADRMARGGLIDRRSPADSAMRPAPMTAQMRGYVRAFARRRFGRRMHSRSADERTGSDVGHN
ncbi:MAG: MarR family transcriptional regulator [Actinomycetota bacterium]|nr:MarR family transcriptional regulator [Actinomycetota bacterium]